MVLEDMFGDALNNMTAVTDRLSAYFVLHSIMDTAHKNKQSELNALLSFI